MNPFCRIKPVLTPRELEIARLVCKGMSNVEIGHALGISERTVQNHLRNTFRATGLANRLELAVLALAHGMVALTECAETIEARAAQVRAVNQYEW